VAARVALSSVRRRLVASESSRRWKREGGKKGRRLTPLLISALLYSAAPRAFPQGGGKREKKKNGHGHGRLSRRAGEERENVTGTGLPYFPSLIHHFLFRQGSVEGRKRKERERKEKTTVAGHFFVSC